MSPAREDAVQFVRREYQGDPLAKEAHYYSSVSYFYLQQAPSMHM